MEAEGKLDAASKYDSISVGQREVGLYLMGKLAPAVGSKVLDLGCGTGYLTKVLADRMGPEGKVVGIDPEVERLEVARKKYSAPNLEYLEGRGEDIPGGGYDMVYSNYVLHWCPDKELIFKQVHKSLKIGGKFGFVAVTYWDFIPKLFTSDMVSPEFEKAARSMMRPPTMDEFKRLISSNHFETVYLEEKEEECHYGNVDKLIEALRVHSHGKFDKMHFNVDAMKRRYGEGEIIAKEPICIVVIRKTS